MFNCEVPVHDTTALSPVTGSSRMSLPPGLRILATSASVSGWWTEELSASRQDSTQSNEDAAWQAEERGGEDEEEKTDERTDESGVLWR